MKCATVGDFGGNYWRPPTVNIAVTSNYPPNQHKIGIPNNFDPKLVTVVHHKDQIVFWWSKYKITRFWDEKSPVETVQESTWNKCDAVWKCDV